MGGPKSQVSLEFLITLSIVLLIFIVSLFILSTKYVASNDLRLEISAKSLANMVPDNINEISAVGPGYSQRFDMPGTLYGSRDYRVIFHRGEARAEIKAGETWSSPLFTSDVGCSMSICNTTTESVTLKPTNTTRVMVSNVIGSICLQDPLGYNLKQGGNEWRIISFRGKNISRGGPDNCSIDPAGIDDYFDGNSSMYLYENTKNGTLGLVFRHGKRGVVDVGDIELNLIRIPRGSKVILSDDNGELNLSRKNKEGSWQWNSTNGDDCDGGNIEFPFPCIRIQIIPIDISTQRWLWINADGSIINLDKTKSITIIYP